MADSKVTSTIKVLHEPSRIKRLANSNLSHEEDIAARYNQLVDAFNQLSDEYALVNTFTQAVFQSDPPKAHEKIKRSIAVALYLPTGTNNKAATDAIRDIVELLGYEPIIDSEMEGSFFKRLAVLSKNFVTQNEVQHEIKKLKRHIENQTVAKSQAEIDGKLATAVSNLLAATKDEESIFMFGSFVVIKVKGGDGQMRTAVKSLTSDEQIVISMEQSILTDPQKFFQNLQSRVVEYRENIKTDSSEEPKVRSDDLALPH